MKKLSNRKSIWLLEYWVLIGSWGFLFATLILSGEVNNSFNPLQWGGRSSFYISCIFLMTVWMTLLYLEQQKKINIERLIHINFNLDEYLSPIKKPLDVILAHYTNVATVGLFLALSIYSVRPLFKWSAPLGGLVLAILSIASFMIYALFIIRLTKRFLNRKSFVSYFFMLLAIFVVDSKAVEMLITSTPKGDAQSTNQEETTNKTSDIKCAKENPAVANTCK